MDAAPGPKVSRLVAALLAKYPKHEQFLDRRFQGTTQAEVETCELLAYQIVKLAGDDLDLFIDGYEFICQILKEEELYFRRNHAYRLTSFQDAVEQVYSNSDYMAAYMRGLLLTQLLWTNHTRSIAFYTDRFLGTLPEGARLLEIGPGHGLLLARAVQTAGPSHVAGWDVSASSLNHTRSALASLGVVDGFTLEARNLFEPQSDTFDAVVFSEVLEHLENPEGALAAIRDLLRPGGRLYLNVPINSPAPDHIYLLRSPEEVFEMVQAQGFKILEHGCFPATNYTLEQAMRHKLTVSVSLIAAPA